MKKIDSKICFCILITFGFFGVFIRIQYAPDTYFVFSDTTTAVVTQFFSCGRFVTGIAAGLCKGLLNLSDNSIYILSYTFAMICTIVSLYRLFNLINKDVKNNMLSIILATLIIINIFSFELFVYIEKGIMMFSILMCILAVEQVDKLLEKRKWKHFILSVLYMLIATCSYQGTVGIFVAISLIYIIKYSRSIKEFLLNNVKVALIYGIPAIINLMMVRFISNNSRIEGDIILSESIYKIIEGIRSLLINTYNLFPKYLFYIYVLAIILFAIYKAIVSRGAGIKEKVLKISGIFYIFIGTLIVTILPQILQNTNCIWFVARSSYPMASTIGLLLIYIFLQFDIKESQKNIIIIICVIFMIIQLFWFIRLAIDGYIGNYKDKEETLEIIRQIELYEKESGNKITKISIYNDKNIIYAHTGIIASGDINIRALSSNWAAKAIINYYSGRKLELIESDKEIQQNFIKEDWEKYNEKQIILEDDIIHLCLY